MATQSKVRLTVECSLDERMYIKMLAAKKQMTISEVLLTAVKKMIPYSKKRTPNSETVEALQESRNGQLESYKTLDDFWKAMGVDPHA